jgi:hypothetical protein
MRHSQLSNEQILLALSESYNIVAAITKYQVFLARIYKSRRAPEHDAVSAAAIKREARLSSLH